MIEAIGRNFFLPIANSKSYAMPMDKHIQDLPESLPGALKFRFYSAVS